MSSSPAPTAVTVGQRLPFQVRVAGRPILERSSVGARDAVAATHAVSCHRMLVLPMSQAHTVSASVETEKVGGMRCAHEAVHQVGVQPPLEVAVKAVETVTAWAVSPTLRTILQEQRGRNRGRGTL